MQRQIATPLLAVFLAAAGGAKSSTYTVDTLADVNPPMGSTTLRAAINTANGHGNSTIAFASALTGGTINLGSALPNMTQSALLQVKGPSGATITINGGGHAIFVVKTSQGALSVSNLTLTNGSAGTGGALDVESAPNGVTLSNVVFSGNTAAAQGGAIFSKEPLAVTSCTFTNNSATVTGISQSGGAIYALNKLVVTDSTFTGNSGYAGGAIALEGSSSANSISGSTFTGNTDHGVGSGVSVGFDSGSPTLSVTNSTFYNDGGNDLFVIRGAANLASVTFASTNGGGLIGVNLNATLNVRSSVLVGCASPLAVKPNSQGHNLVADNSCSFTAAGDMQSAVAALTVFGLNGGATETLEPAAGVCTPVTNNGDATNAGSTDQNGAARTATPSGQPATDDIGSIEMSSHLPCIAAQPAAVTAFVGQPFSLTVTTITRQYLPSSTYETYQWSFGGAAINNAKSATYTKTAAVSDQGNYSVSVINPFGAVTSSTVMVTVLDKPVFTTQPADANVFAGQAFTLTAAVANTASVTYQWYLGANAIGGATSSSYSVSNAQAANAGSYTVKATNPAGTTTSNAAIVALNGAPTIATQPANQTAFIGKPFSLTVTAQGQQLTYQWQKSNGSAYVNISGATASSYTVTSAQASDAGSYQVIVTNPSGSVTSSAATVTVNGPPAITTQPAAQTTLFTTQTLNLSVVASGVSLTYQWFLGGAVIAGATGSTYTVASAQSTDAGTYYVIVTNGAGAVQSANAVVTINGPATITSQPVNTTIYATQTLMLSVTATGQSLSYQWQKQGASGTYANISGATSSTYSNPNATTADAGVYRVQVSNPGGTTNSNPATVTVNAAPTITTQPSGQTIYAGQALQLSVVGNGQGLQFQWFHGATAITGANAATYSDGAAQSSDAGNYYVIVSNAAGSVTSNTVVVVVNGPPTIATQPSGQSVYATQPLSLSVVANGQGLTYQWQKQSGAAFVNITSNAQSATYSVASSAASDAGNYQVVITNPAGNVTSNSVAVVINGAPVITAQPQGKAVFAGQPFSLSVTAAGQGLQYQWLLGGAPINGATSATYAVAAAAQANAGTYSVQVSNPAGSITSENAVVTIAPAPTISQQPANQTLFTTQKLTITVTASGSSLSYQWQKLSSGVYSNISGATAASYVVNSAATTDAGSYQVIVSNPAGSVTSGVAVVTINGPPVITVNPVSQSVDANSSLTFSGDASGLNVTFQWQKGGVDIAGATNKTFTIASVQVSDAGTYHLKAINPGGTATSSDATLSVNGAPAITSQPAPQTLFVGQALSLSVTASGAALTYQWFFKGIAINGATTSAYSVASAQTADAGAYYVNITNGAGTVQSNTVSVVVNPAPTIATQPAAQTVYATQPLSLSVVANGASLSYQWLKLSGSGYAPIGGATASTYMVASAANSDAGSYEVTVSNGAGSVTSNPAVVTVNGAPQITTNPQSQTVFAGAMVTLTAAASGTVTNYQWQLNGADIPGATSAALTFASIQVTDAGSYHLKATNPAGSATSTDAVITVNGAPKITQQPVGQTLFATQPLQLSVTASGAALTYQWSLNGSAISGATGATYSVASSGVADGGTYTVLVSNGAGALQSNNTSVVVKPAPSITTQPADQTLFVTQPFTLSVVASGDQLTYQWQLKQGSAAFQNIVCPMGTACATGSAYSVDNAPVTASGSYRVQIANPAGTITSSTANVNVIGPPAIVANPQSQAAFLGQPFALSVTAAGGSLSYQWRKNQQPIAGAQTSSYMVQSAASPDAGAYDVVVSNGAGTATSAIANVSVNGPPTIVNDLADQSLYAGLSFNLSVTAAGAGLHYAWYLNNMRLVDDTNSYGVGSAQVSDAGNYRVDISNGAGSVSSRVAVVVIDGAPVITSQPVGATLFAGQPFMVAITATGQDLAYQWRQNGAAIPGANLPAYSVAAAAVTDTGSYDCVVNNPAGNTTSRAAVVSVGGAPVITRQPVSASVVKGASLSLGVVAAGVDLHYQWSKDGLEIGAATSSSYAIAAVADTDSGSYTCKVSNQAGSTTSNAAEIAIVQCLGDSDCAGGYICNPQAICVPKPVVPILGCANGGAACEGGSSCDVTTNSCKIDTVVGGCASSDGITALSLLALALFFVNRAKRSGSAIAR
jgi:predicted outer membrane repeat protein